MVSTVKCSLSITPSKAGSRLQK